MILFNVCNLKKFERWKMKGQSGDYDDLYFLEEDDIIPLIEPAEKFIAEIENLINHNNWNK